MSFRGSHPIEQNPQTKDLQNLSYIVAVSLIFGIASGFMTSGPEYYQSEKCVSLLDWTKWYFYYNIMVFVCSVLLLFAKKYDKSGPNSENRMCINNTYQIFFAFCGLTICVILVGVSYSLDLDEPCGQLRTFVRVTTIIALAILSLYVIFMFCTCAFGMWTLFMARRRENYENNTELHLREGAL